jgi:hypothetical protein
VAINIGSVTIGNLWKSQTELFSLVISHMNRYPAMEVQDVYTLIYQGAMGAVYLSADAGEFEPDPNRNKEKQKKGTAIGDTIPLALGMAFNQRVHLLGRVLLYGWRKAVSGGPKLLTIDIIYHLLTPMYTVGVQYRAHRRWRLV